MPEEINTLTESENHTYQTDEDHGIVVIAWCSRVRQWSSCVCW